MQFAAKPPLSVLDFARQTRGQEHRFLAWGALLATWVGVVLALLGVERFPLPLLMTLAFPAALIIWHSPRVVFYGVMAAACLFELQLTPFPDALTDRVPFFWNVNTIIQHNGQANFKGIPTNPFELLMVVTGVCSAFKASVGKNTRLTPGRLFIPIAAYLVFVVWGLVNGLATGGEFKVALQEIRPQFHLILAYLLAVNLIRETRHLTVLMWVAALCIAFKGAVYTYRMYVTLAGQPVPDQGVGSHEEAMLFDGFILLLLSLWVCGSHHKLQAVMWALLPLVLLGNVACNRRASTAAIVIALPILLIVAYGCIPRRRKMAAVVGLTLAAILPPYYFAFRNSESQIGQPARAIRSHFEPSARDLSSNLYRDAENANLMATIRSAPVQGFGYGKPMLTPFPMADISGIYEFWNILPHNQVLWVWMRIGTLGFIVFWVMIAAVLIRAIHSLREQQDPALQSASLFCVLCVTLLLMFGLLDLQLSNMRDMIFTGAWIGVIGGLCSRKPEPVKSVGEPA